MLKKAIKTVLVDQDKSVSVLAERLGERKNTFYSKVRKDDFKESELCRIAEGLDCTYITGFIDNQTGKKYIVTHNERK